MRHINFQLIPQLRPPLPLPSLPLSYSLCPRQSPHWWPTVRACRGHARPLILQGVMSKACRCPVIRAGTLEDRWSQVGLFIIWPTRPGLTSPYLCLVDEGRASLSRRIAALLFSQSKARLVCHPGYLTLGTRGLKVGLDISELTTSAWIPSATLVGRPSPTHALL